MNLTTTNTVPAQYFFSSPVALHGRARVLGKFVYVGNDKFYVRGVTYGPFRPDANGLEYANVKLVEHDLDQMALHGINAFRTYTVPPRWLLDAAEQRGLRVMVGLPWEEHVAFLEDSNKADDIEYRVRAGVEACSGHPSVLCYAVGNEIPSSIARWYGARRVEGFIERLYHAAKAEDPGALVTYVNYPSTEYLRLPFLDLVSYNVFLESPDRLEAYIARLHNLAGERPLLLSEIGLDSRRNGELTQARSLQGQIHAIFSSGGAGAFVFAWTDEWFRGGFEIHDWDFGLTDRSRRPKPAFGAVRDAFARVPIPIDSDWPRISVVVCSHDGARTITECCEGLAQLDYPNFEVIVVDDGSRDGTGAVGNEFGFRVIRTENHGLANARNVGMNAATGEIIAYIDDDAFPDPHWLTYLASSFKSTNYAAVGGPNIAPMNDGWIPECVANAPGNPVHVLLSDQLAEHIPGCNMAIRRDCLQAIGGFDSQFRVAGDDVDVCWRLRERGWTVGFHPAAVVWHHRRNSIWMYAKQQIGYGRAEALLQKKWPQKYNAYGHFTWAGRVYGKGLTQGMAMHHDRIFHGTWGSALFQSIYQSMPGGLWWLPLIPEWYLVILAGAALSALGIFWPPMFAFLVPLACSVGILIAQAALSASTASFSTQPRPLRERAKMRGLVLFLHLLQPFTRLVGRRWHLGERNTHLLFDKVTMRLPRVRTSDSWCAQWRSAEDWLQSIEGSLRKRNGVVFRGGNYDRWDLQVRGGILASVRLLVAIEEHGAGKQLLRFKIWPRFSPLILAVNSFLLALSAGAALGESWAVYMLIALTIAYLTARTMQQCEDAMQLTLDAVGSIHTDSERYVSERNQAAESKNHADQPSRTFSS
jgi:cellulose synthase/poly-beta-1,6-N-acetylglucosamine synthase-like glycosyltransferase